MNSQRHSSGSYFGPRQNMSRRLAVANGLPLRKSEDRFRPTRMLKIAKECQKTNMKFRNMCKSNRDVNDQANVVKQAKKNPPVDSNVGPSNALQPTTSSLANSLNPSPMDIECSKPSRARNMLAPKEVEMLATRKTEGDSNVTSRCLDEAHHHKEMDRPSRNMETSHPTHLRAMGRLVRRAKTVDTSSLNKSKKKQRKDIEMNKYEYGISDQHRKHCVEQRCYCCSKPIDEPKWSVMFKIDGKKYISLAGHLSTKSCEKVRELSPLPRVVQVTKVPRLAAWSKIWKASKPTGDSIGLYFFPHEMRHDEELDQLVKEVINKDLVLQAVIGEAEMLIFPSVLLPERYQTFQTKHYLWAAFKAKEDKCAATVEQEEDREEHVSNQIDDVQSKESGQEMILMKCAKPLENQQLPARSIHEVETCCIQGPTNTCLERDALERRRPRDSSHQAVCNSASTAIAIDAATDATTSIVPSEATSFAGTILFFLQIMDRWIQA